MLKDCWKIDKPYEIVGEPERPWMKEKQEKQEKQESQESQESQEVSKEEKTSEKK